MSRSQMISALAPTAKPTPGPLLVVKHALESLSDIDFGTPEYTEATQAVFEVAQTQRTRVLHGSHDSLVLARVILGLARFLSVDWTQPGIEVSKDGERPLLASAYSFNPSQARAPKGTSIGGQWIDTPSAMLRYLNTLRGTPLMNLTEEGREAIPALSAEVARTIENYYLFGTDDARAIFEGSDETMLSRTYGNEEFSVDVTVTHRVSTIAIEGMVLDRWGNEAGYFQRTIFRDLNTGEMVVNHEHLELLEPYRRKGFGTDFSRQSEEMYADLGITRINVTAGLDDGGLAWARAGYEINEDQAYIDFDHRVTGEFQATLEAYRATEDYATIDFLEGLAQARRSRGSLENTSGFVNLGETGYTIDDILAFKDANGLPIGEELLRGSTWDGHKYIEPSAYSQSVPVPEPALAASGRGTSWAESKERADMLWEFCFSTGAEYTDDDWTTEQANAWRALDADGRARWNSGLMASGFAFNPNQARAPKGSSIGGRWILTPSGLLQEASTGKSPREALPLNHPPIELEATNNKWIAAIYNSPEDIKSIEDLKALADLTQEALADAYRRPVSITVPTRAINDIVSDGRVHSIHHPDVVGTKYDLYVKNRSAYEHEVMGVPLDRPVEDMPIYGWGRRKDSGATIGYGDTTIQLKKEVNQRTTYTVGDSMNQAVIPIWGEDIENAHMSEMVMRSQWAVEYYLQNDDGQSVMERSWREGPLGQHMWANYVEAQVHGGVTLDDIEGIYIGPNAFKDLSMEALNTLIDRDIEVIFESSPILPYQATARETILTRWPDGPPASLPAAAKWYGPDALAASGTYSYNPNQARAPRGTPRGGQWIETPTGMLRLVQTMGPTGEGRSEPGTDVPGLVLNRKAPLEEKFAEAWDDLSGDERVELALNTKNYLQAAAEEPVKIQMWDNAIEGLAAEGRMHTMRERIFAEDYYNGSGYIIAREGYEENIAGVPTNLSDDQRPLYGWAQQADTMWGEGVANYGPNTLTLREEVKARTTLTIGDSLNYQSRPLWIDEINDEGTSTDEFLAASHWAIERRYNEDMEIKAINPGLWDGGWEINGDSYIEAQVYGGITLRDIESITIQSRFDYDEGTLQVFEDAGIEIITGDGS